MFRSKRPEASNPLTTCQLKEVRFSERTVLVNTTQIQPVIDSNVYRDSIRPTRDGGFKLDSAAYASNYFARYNTITYQEEVSVYDGFFTCPGYDRSGVGERINTYGHSTEVSAQKALIAKVGELGICNSCPYRGQTPIEYFQNKSLLMEEQIRNLTLGAEYQSQQSKQLGN